MYKIHLFLIFLLIPYYQIRADDTDGRTWIVNTTVDENDSPASGDTSLREALLYSDDGDIIEFDTALSGNTLILTLGELSVTKSICISAANLMKRVTVQASADSRIFRTEADLVIKNLRLTSGNIIEEGGAIHNEASELKVIDSVFENNTADNGGAIYTAETTTLERCLFRNNHSVFNGGAIYNISELTICNNCTFVKNSSTASAGAILNTSTGFSNTQFTNCSFQGNSARNGGAISNSFSSPSFTNCTFQGNSSTDGGGGIRNLSFSSPSFRNCIIWNNTENGGISTTLGASISNIPSFSVEPTFFSCLIENWSIADLGAENNTLDGTNPANDPRFLDTDRGDLRLGQGSPAINAGNNDNNASTIDLAGNPRINDSTIDLGAFEFHGSQVPLPSRSLRIYLSEGEVVLEFDRDLAAEPSTNWFIHQSADLSPNSFQEIYSFTGSSGNETLTEGISSVIGIDTIRVTINSTPQRSFFRLLVEQP